MDIPQRTFHVDGMVPNRFVYISFLKLWKFTSKIIGKL